MHHVIVSSVVGIGDGLEERLIASGFTDILGWAGTGRRQNRWANYAGGGIVDPPDANAVVSIIARVCKILDSSGASFL